MTKSLFALIFFFLLIPAQGLPRGNSYVAPIPVVDGPHELGEIKTSIEDEKLKWVDKKSLIQILGPRLTPDMQAALEKLPSRITPEILPIPLRFDPQKFVLEVTLDLELKGKEKTHLGLDLSEQAAPAIHPSPFGGGVNYNLEKSWAHRELGGNALSGQFDSFINANTLVLESLSYYQNDADQDKWYRGDTRLVKDFQEHEIRTQFGDINPLVQGFMVGRPLGGINVQRNFGLNPYRLPYPTGSQDFTLKSRSFVRYYVNSVLIKSEYLPAGNYSANDIPLNNGLNTIVIEATDELGQKQFFTFRASSSIDLLNEKEARFDLSYGTPYLDETLKRKYVEEEGKLFSGFLQYGFSRTFSSSLYLQNQKEFTLTGTELIKATPLGNFTGGHALSRQGAISGRGSSLGYQLITQGEKWFDSHTLNLRWENRDENFRGSLMELSSSVQNLYAVNYTVPLSNLMTVSAGGSYGDVRDNQLSDRYGIDSNVSIRIFRDHSLTLFVSRTRDEFKQWNDVAYAFLTLTFPENNNYISTLYDHNQKSTRMTYLRDNQNQLHSFRSQVTAETGENSQSGEVDLLYPTTFANLSARIQGLKNREEEKDSMRGSVRINSAFVFAYEDGQMGAGLSRPVPGSFVIFSPGPALKGQKIALRSTSPFNEASSGPFGEITFSNLLAYQYRDVQLDPTMMDEGRSLVKEKFVLYPTYRSAHLIKLHERGSVTLSGRLLNADGTPVVLQVGKIGGTTFFTNREGEFFVEGISPKGHILSLDGREETLPVMIGENNRGLINLGPLKFKDEL